MGAFIFTIKTIILTALVIAVLQIRWEGETLEDHLAYTARETGIINMADTMARGAIRFFNNNFGTQANDDVDLADKTQELVRSAKLGFSRSESYMSKKSETAKQAIEKFRRDLQEEQDNEVLQEDLTFEE